MSCPIQLITIGTPDDHCSVAEISSYLVSVAAGSEVVALLHLGKHHKDLWRAVAGLGWEFRECFPDHQVVEAPFLSACLREVFSLVESASKFPSASSVFGNVVVAYFELSDLDLLLLRLISRIQSPYFEVCAQMRV
jgi:hypothetical protein